MCVIQYGTALKHTNDYTDLNDLLSWAKVKFFETPYLFDILKFECEVKIGRNEFQAALMIMDSVPQVSLTFETHFKPTHMLVFIASFDRNN